jgi:hypothetical protein
MEYIKELITRVNNFNAPMGERYPELNNAKSDGKTKILFMSPILNKQGVFRMIFPAIELQVSGKFSCIVSNIIPDKCNLTIDDFNVKIQPELIQWADFVVFAANGQDMTPLIAHLKELNPNVKIVMDVDRLYHRLNPSNYSSKRFRVGNRMKMFVNNLTTVDLVTFPDKVTEDYYSKLTNNSIRAKIIPNLISPHLFTGINFNQERPIKERRTILILADSDDYDDLNNFRDALGNVITNFPDSDVVVFGNCVNFEEKNPFRFLGVKKVTYKDMTDYYKKLWELNADVAIIPVKRESYYRPYYKLLELAVFGCPMVSINDYPFNHLLKKDSTILLSGNKRGFISNIKYLFYSEEERQKLLKTAQGFVLQNYIFSNKNMFRAYEDLFQKQQQHQTQPQ